MKIKLALIALCAVIFANSAQAIEIETENYVGYDMATTRYKFGGVYNHEGLLKRDYFANQLVAGIKTNYYFGVEAFLQRTNRETQHTYLGRFTTNHYAFGVDLLGYIPVYRDFDIIGGIGLGSYYFRVRNSIAENHNKHAYATRYTLAAQYNLDENWGIRATVRYIKASNSDFFKHGNEYAFGIRYTF